MGLGVGLILAAVGAVLAFAVNTSVNGVDIHTIGWILLIVGMPRLLQPPSHRVLRRGPRRTRRPAVLEATSTI